MITGWSLVGHRKDFQQRTKCVCVSVCVHSRVRVSTDSSWNEIECLQARFAEVTCDSWAWFDSQKREDGPEGAGRKIYETLTPKVCLTPGAVLVSHLPHVHMWDKTFTQACCLCLTSTVCITKNSSYYPYAIRLPHVKYWPCNGLNVGYCDGSLR